LANCEVVSFRGPLPHRGSYVEQWLIQNYTENTNYGTYILLVSLGPSIRTCNLIFILCVSGFLVSPEEKAYYITLNKTGLLISKSFLPAFTNSCPTTVLFALLLLSLLVGAKREIFWPSICSQNHAPIQFFGALYKTVLLRHCLSYNSILRRIPTI